MFSGLLNSVVDVYRQSFFNEDGIATAVYVLQGAPLSGQNVRLDTVFLRPGKSAPEPTQAGRAPDRIGTMFASVDCGFLAGDIITAVPNAFGEIPVPGTFQIRVIPDVAIGYSAAHHCEIEIVETSQVLIDPVRPFPGQVLFDELG